MRKYLYVIILSVFAFTLLKIAYFSDQISHEGALVKDINGNLMLVDAHDDTVSRIIYNSGVWEPHINKAINRVIRDGDRALVVGAHIGFHGINIAKLAGDDGEVFAFEPNSRTLKFLNANVAVNGLENVTVYPTAVYSHKTKLKFHAIDNGNTGMSHVHRDDEKSTNYIEIDAIDIDSIPEIKDINFIIMDIECMETKAMLGAKDLLDNSPEDLLILQEWSPECTPSMPEYLSFLRERGYKIAEVSKDERAPYRELSDSELINSPVQLDVAISKSPDRLKAVFDK